MLFAKYNYEYDMIHSLQSKSWRKMFKGWDLGGGAMCGVVPHILLCSVTNSVSFL
jgi:hypothetical protein